MTYNIFLDTDVVLDLLTDRQPFSEQTAEIFELNEQGLINIHISAISINNIYYIARKFLSHQNTLDVIASLIEVTEIIGTTKAEIMGALQNNFSDFEDAIQYSSVLSVNTIDTILTRNIKDYKNSKIAVMTPVNFLKIIRNKN